MSFDKTKAMRSAEKYVAQGKIRAAITEYRSVVDNDPRDIATLNMLGDLHAKNSERKEAVDCYLKVAEHYSTQGFAQKAIAVYNKISRLQPDSIEVSTKLAELYKVKGSLAEARSHYENLADHYEKGGRRIEALSMWKQIALLDPNNTEVCINLADSYMREGQRIEAAEAYAEAGTRFSRQNRHEEAIKAFAKSFDINSDDIRTLDGMVKAHSALGRVNKAVSLLDEILENEPYNRDVLYLLIDCHIDSQNAQGAERAVIKLVELEPANYPKLLDLIRIYLNAGDLDSAARILSMSSEYLLAAGHGDECNRWITEILDRDAFHVAGLRMLVRYCSWLNEEKAFQHALERLALSARKSGSAEDEYFALSKLVVLRPFDTANAERLEVLVQEHGFSAESMDTDFVKAKIETETESAFDSSVDAPLVERNGFEISSVSAEIVSEAVSASNGHSPETHQPEQYVLEPSATLEQRIAKEIESIEFYIENGYSELAEKAIFELEVEAGPQPEIDALKAKLRMGASEAFEIVETIEPKEIGIEEIRSEFGLEEAETSAENDFETQFQTAIAYQEMGLMEEAIKFFQEAIGLVTAADNSRRFFRCATLIGHCFMETGHPNHSVTWFERALDTPELTDDERLGLWYELALAYAAEGRQDEAHRYFEMVYAENINFRDVAEQLKSELALS